VAGEEVASGDLRRRKGRGEAEVVRAAAAGGKAVAWRPYRRRGCGTRPVGDGGVARSDTADRNDGEASDRLSGWRVR
jgi:hypothetical protein